MTQFIRIGDSIYKKDTIVALRYYRDSTVLVLTHYGSFDTVGIDRETFEKVINEFNNE